MSKGYDDLAAVQASPDAPKAPAQAVSKGYDDLPAPAQPPVPDSKQLDENAGYLKSAADIAETVTNPIGRILGRGVAATASNLYALIPGITKQQADFLYKHLQDATDREFSPDTEAGQAVQNFVGGLTPVKAISDAFNRIATGMTNDPVKQDAIKTIMQTSIMGPLQKTAQGAGTLTLKAAAAGGETAGTVAGGVVGGLKGGPLGVAIGAEKGGWLGGKIAQGAQSTLDRQAAARAATEGPTVRDLREPNANRPTEPLNSGAGPRDVPVARPELKDQPSFAGAPLNSGAGPADVPVPASPNPFVEDIPREGTVKPMDMQRLTDTDKARYYSQRSSQDWLNSVLGR